MNQKIKALLNEQGENHIFPFFWLHGEDEPILREYMAAIHDCGIGAVCVESRPHPDYCGPKWWQDMDVILDEARQRNMKVWILDDSHFPTGFANGALKEAPPELCRQFLYYSALEVVGPLKSVQLDVSRHAKFMPNPFAGNSFFSRGQQDKRQFDDDTLLSVCVARIDQGFDGKTLIDVTDLVKDGQLTWDVPAGKWKIYVNFLTRNAGSRSHYINWLNPKSAQKQIEAVYEPHLEHYAEDFGKTIAGFFSDEPELGNGAMYSNDCGIGAEQDLPWSDEVAAAMADRLGDSWTSVLPMLWEESIDPDQKAHVRYVYMDIVTRLVEQNLSERLGSWCESHGVEYIGHLIEDNNTHARLGPSLGHFFRALSGQHMSGIDDIGGQVMPFGEKTPTWAIISGRDGEFYHYLLGKLGSSLAAINPKMKGRTMCEIFGAYRWAEGVRMMKYLVDHFLVRGVNNYVPHAFSAKPYPDPDCPPHFYAHGHNPQYRHFGALMRYLNRMSDLISDGRRSTPVAILYHAEAEWTGDYMLDQKPAKVLTENQIDFDIVPSDIFAEMDQYKTALSSSLSVNSNTYKALVVPAAQYITRQTAEALAELSQAGYPVLFIDAKPSGVIDGDDALLTGLADCQIVSLDDLAGELANRSIPEITATPAFPMLRAMHYQGDSDIYIFTNENMAESFSGTVCVDSTGPAYRYDAWQNDLRQAAATPKNGKTELQLEVQPYQSVVFVFDDAKDLLPAIDRSAWRDIGFGGRWVRSLAKSIDYPEFSDPEPIDSFDSVGLSKPDFSGFIRYENTVDLPKAGKASLLIEDAFEGVEVFVNGQSAGIQIAPPFAFELDSLLKEGRNTIRIEVATTLERERHFAPPDPQDFFSILGKAPVLAPTGIVGKVRLVSDNTPE